MRTSAALTVQHALSTVFNDYTNISDGGIWFHVLGTDTNKNIVTHAWYYSKFLKYIDLQNIYKQPMTRKLMARNDENNINVHLNIWWRNAQNG